MPEQGKNNDKAQTHHPCRLQIHGRVQGVGYRISAQREAERLGLSGWVRNCSDGHVEIQVNGPGEAVASFIEWCYKGPPGSQVSRVDIAQDVAPRAGSFEIRSTI